MCFRPPTTDTATTCPECGVDVSSSDTACLSCGAAITPMTVGGPPPAPGVPKAPDMAKPASPPKAPSPPAPPKAPGA